MNLLVSECSSGCESGWTLYFEHSITMDASHRDPALFRIEADGKRVADEVEDGDEYEEEEEDLSMVSDASSGPPHLHEEDEEVDQYQCHGGRFSNNGGGFGKTEYPVPETGDGSVSFKCKRKKKMEDQHHPSSLDDTASSPFINFFPNSEFMLTNNGTPLESVFKYSHGFSSTDYEGNSAFQHQFDMLQPSLSSHQFQRNQWTGRKKMEFR